MNIIFLGRKKYSAKMIEWLLSKGVNIECVVTDSHLPASPTEKKAKELGIDVVSIEQAEDMVKEKNVDLVISYLYWRKIKEPFISTPKFGCINFHPAILPDWRGVAGYNIAILNRLDKWGTSAHYVNSEIDTGDIIRSFTFDIDYRTETAYTLEKKTMAIQMDLFKSVMLDVIDMGILPRLPQKESAGKYISRKDLERMRHIDVDVDDIDLKIRAFWFPPYGGACINISNKEYTLVNDFILKSLVDKDTTYNA